DSSTGGRSAFGRAPCRHQSSLLAGAHGRDQEVLGKTIHVDTFRGGAFQIVGVMPATFDLPHGADIWVSLGDWGAAPCLLPTRPNDAVPGIPFWESSPRIGTPPRVCCSIGRKGYAAAGDSGGQPSIYLVGIVRGCRLHLIDRVRERGQPSVVAEHRPAQGNVDAQGSRCYGLADRATVVWGKPGP